MDPELRAAWLQELSQVERLAAAAGFDFKAHPASEARVDLRDPRAVFEHPPDFREGYIASATGMPPSLHRHPLDLEGFAGILKGLAEGSARMARLLDQAAHPDSGPGAV